MTCVRGCHLRRLFAALVALGLVLVGLVGVASAAVAYARPLTAAVYTYDSLASVEHGALAEHPAVGLACRSAPSGSVVPSQGLLGLIDYFGVAAETEAGGVSQAFHYTSSEYAQSIAENGLRPGSYATPNGSLSPLQAQLELALPPTRALPGATVQIDVAGLRGAGYEIPAVSRVSSTVTGAGGRVYTMPGGGYEMNFPYAIPPQFLKVVG